MKQQHLEDFSQQTFQTELVEWFHSQKRDLPWRQTNDPYKIWVSEIMLQQTRVETVIPYYLAFIRQFPTLIDLANAQEDEILKAWEGLGTILVFVICSKQPNKSSSNLTGLCLIRKRRYQA